MKIYVAIMAFCALAATLTAIICTYGRERWFEASCCTEGIGEICKCTNWYTYEMEDHE